MTELSAAVARIGTYEWPHKITDAQRAFLEAVSEAFEVELDPDQAEETLARLGSIARMVGATMSNTANPTMLSAGYKHNVIPGRADGGIDGRFVPGGEDEFYATIADLIGDKVRYEVVAHKPSVETAVLRRPGGGDAGLPGGGGSGRPGRALPDERGHRRQGLAPRWHPVLRLRSAAAASRLDFVGMFHGVDERVPTESLEFGARVLDRFLDRRERRTARRAPGCATPHRSLRPL